MSVGSCIVLQRRCVLLRPEVEGFKLSDRLAKGGREGSPSGGVITNTIGSKEVKVCKICLIGIPEYRLQAAARHVLLCHPSVAHGLATLVKQLGGHGLLQLLTFTVSVKG